jgi:hypothetical protein
MILAQEAHSNWPKCLPSCDGHYLASFFSQVNRQIRHSINYDPSLQLLPLLPQLSFLKRVW